MAGILTSEWFVGRYGEQLQDALAEAGLEAEVITVPPDPDAIRLGMPVRLVTYPAGTDSEGTECIAFGFAPAEA